MYLKLNHQGYVLPFLSVEGLATTQDDLTHWAANQFSC